MVVASKCRINMRLDVRLELVERDAGVQEEKDVNVGAIVASLDGADGAIKSTPA